MEYSDRVDAFSKKFQEFLDTEVAEVQESLDKHNVGTVQNPTLDEHGRMHRQIWEARREIQQRSASVDLYCPHMPSQLGGLGFSREEMHSVEETVTRRSGLGLGLAALAWTEGPNPALEYASDAAREQYVDPLIKGRLTTAFANTEVGAGSDVLRMETNAQRNGSDWIINGTKSWITNAPFADFIQVIAVTDADAGKESLTMFLVDKDAPGFSRGNAIPTILEDGLTGELRFEDVRVPSDNVVGEVGDGFRLAMTWINWRRLCRGGMCAGWGSWLIGRAIERARTRRVGRKTLAEHQAIQHMLADMEVDRYSARATSLIAQAELDKLGPFDIPLHPEARRLISLVKLTSDEAFFRLTDRAVQVHGANGLLRGTPEEKLFRVARNLRIPAGTVEIQRNAIAQSLFGAAAKAEDY